MAGGYAVVVWLPTHPSTPGVWVDPSDCSDGTKGLLLVLVLSEIWMSLQIYVRHPLGGTPPLVEKVKKLECLSIFFGKFLRF